MGLIVPNLLELADVGQLAGLAAPRPLVISQCVEPDGELATPERVSRAFAYCEQVYRLLGAAEKLKILRKVELCVAHFMTAGENSGPTSWVGSGVLPGPAADNLTLL